MRDYTTSDVTIVVATVERPGLLQACLESLLRTTPPGVGLLVFFNGTTEATRRRVRPLIDSWEGPVNVAGCEQTVPLEVSHQSALDLVQTRLVNFMGDDDLVLTPRLQLLVDAFNEIQPEPAAMTSWARRIAGSEHMPHIGSLKALGPTSVEEWADRNRKGGVFEMLWPGAVLRTELLRDIGFEGAFRLSIDNRIFTRLAEVGPVLALPHDGFGYRIHHGSISSGGWKAQHQHARYVERCNTARRTRQEEPTFDSFVNEERASPAIRRVRRSLRSRSRMHFRRGGELMLSGHPVSGLLHFLVSLAVWPPSFLEKLRDQLPRSRSASRRPVAAGRKRPQVRGGPAVTDVPDARTGTAR